MKTVYCVLIMLVMCVVVTALLLIMRRHTKRKLAKFICNLGICGVIAYLSLIFAALTFSHNSYDHAYNKAFVQFWTDRTAGNRVILEQEARRKRRDEAIESIATSIVLVLCVLASYRLRTKHPNQLPDGTQ
jgi:hypothetical protein